VAWRRRVPGATTVALSGVTTTVATGARGLATSPQPARSRTPVQHHLVMAPPLGHPPRLSPHEIHQNELPQRHRVGEVRLAATDRTHLLHELDQAAVARQHEGVDHDARAPAQRYLAVRGLEARGIGPPGVAGDARVGTR